MIVLVGGEKGGSGKSTVASNLATWLAFERDVILLDADKQMTSKKWTDRRNEAGLQPVVHVAQAVGDVSRPAKDLAGRYQEVVIDAGGRDSKELRSALVVADILIVPLKASAPDLDTMEHVNELVSLARGLNPGLKAYALLSMAPSNPLVTEVADAKQFLVDFAELELAPVVIRDRKAYRDAILAGQGVVEGPNGQAKAEIQLLGQFIYHNDI